jgi:citrate/tricarballylate utilization protein
MFDVNVPAAFATLRRETYATYVWPNALAGLFRRNGLFVALTAAVSVAVFVIVFVAVQDPAILFERHGGDFYRLMPHLSMVTLFGLVFLYAIVAMVMSLRSYWRDINVGGPKIGVGAFLQAVRDACELRYLHGGGGGCTSETDQPSPARRIFHHFTFYGFLFCFASTCVATIEHYVFAAYAPYPYLSAPVVLGLIGGLGLIVGPIGLYVLTLKRAPHLTDEKGNGMNEAFLWMLLLTAFTGLLLVFLRATAVMGMLLAVHLGFVLALFLTLPYGKFVHGLYRFLALVKYAAERKQGTFVE